MPDCLPEPSELRPPLALEGGRGLLPYLASHVVYLLTMIGFFLADITLPRGATVAIGYCLVPVFARRLGDRQFLIVVTGICTVLTWIGYVFEPAGAELWMSVFDRGMVTGVLWLTLLLVWQQMDAEIALEQQAQALQNAVDELHRSNAELESFASVVSHDIRGPLASIDLAVKLLSTRPAITSDAESSGWLESISSEINQVCDLIQTLLAYGRVGASEVNLSDCDSESILARVRQALHAEVENTGAEVTNDPLPVIRADPALLAELFQNLIENGIKYRQSAPPRIYVSARATSEGWLFSVRDNGIGMSREECARVFDPFYRGAAGGCSTGFGLGLATCKRIVDRHGGHIEAQSTPGQGSTFSFVIPALAGTASSPA